MPNKNILLISDIYSFDTNICTHIIGAHKITPQMRDSSVF